MGFFTTGPGPADRSPLGASQSLSGWDGVFHQEQYGGLRGIFVKSQSLSGWDGVFHGEYVIVGSKVSIGVSQSLSGWDGVFHLGTRFL